MCSPAAAFWAISLAVTAYSGVRQANAEKASGQYQAEVAKQNADLNDLRATQAATIGSIQEDQHRAKVRQMVGAQRAQYGANGIDLSSGVVQDMTDQTTMMGETEALTIRYNAMNEAWGYRTQAVNDRNEGRFAKWAGRQKATGTYLSTASSLASQGYGGYSSGMFGGGGATKSGGTNIKGYG